MKRKLEPESSNFASKMCSNMAEPTQFLTNEKGERIAVVISIEDYEKILDDLEELWAIREYDDAKAAGELPIPFDEAVANIERNRNRK